MTPNKKHILVGVTVLTALASLAWMIVAFGGNLAAPFTPAPIPVQFAANRADGLGDGSPVFYLGVEVGRVTRVRLQGVEGVVINATVSSTVELPENVEGFIRSPGFIGGTTQMSLEVVDGPPRGRLAPGTQMTARFVGMSILPPEVLDLSRELRLTVVAFRESNILEHIDQQIGKLGLILDSAYDVLGDDTFRGDVKQSVANLRQLTEQTNLIAADLQTFAKRLDDLGTQAGGVLEQARQTAATADRELQALSRQINERFAEAARLLHQSNQLIEKINAGQGTAGQLVNDPRLYQGLVDTTTELNRTIKDLQRLVRQWEEEGVSLKLR